MHHTHEMPPETPTERELLRRLIARDRAPDDAAAAAAAAHDACDRVCRELSRWVGTGGSDALIGRALAEARAQHPVLAEVHIDNQSNVSLKGVAESIKVHNGADVARGLESFLESLIGLLGRLIGYDLAATFVDRSALNDSPEAGNYMGRRVGS
jgi:hypothetical protein